MPRHQQVSFESRPIGNRIIRITAFHVRLGLQKLTDESATYPRLADVILSWGELGDCR